MYSRRRSAGPAQSMSAGSWALVCALSILWGLGFFLNTIALRELDPFTINLARIAIAALVLAAAVYLGGLRLPSTGGQWVSYTVMAILNCVIPFNIVLWSQTHISAGLAAILNASTPLFSVLVAHFVTGHERITFVRLAGIVVGLMGVSVVIGHSVLDEPDHNTLAQIGMLVAAILYALAAAYGRRFRYEPPLVTAAGQFVAATIVMVPVALVFGKAQIPFQPSNETVGAVAVLGIVCMGLGYIIAFRVLAAAGGTNMLLVTLMIPASAVLLDTAFLGRSLEANHLEGFALIGFGLAIVDGRLVRRVRMLW